MNKINELNDEIEEKISQFYKSGRKVGSYIITILAVIYDLFFAFYSKSLEEKAIGVIIVAMIILIVLFWGMMFVFPLEKEEIEYFLQDWRKYCYKQGEYYGRRLKVRIKLRAIICILIGIVALIGIIPTFIIGLSLDNQFFAPFFAHMLYIIGTFLLKFGCSANSALKKYVCKKCGCCFSFEKENSRNEKKTYIKDAEWDSEDVVIGEIKIGNKTAAIHQEHYFKTAPESEWTSSTTNWDDICCNCGHIEKRKEEVSYKNKDL